MNTRAKIKRENNSDCCQTTSYIEKRFLISPRNEDESSLWWRKNDKWDFLSRQGRVLWDKFKFESPAGLLCPEGVIMQGAPSCPLLESHSHLLCFLSRQTEGTKFNHNFKDDWTWSVLIIACPNCGYVDRSDLIINGKYSDNEDSDVFKMSR